MSILYTQEIVDSIKTHKKMYCNEDVDFSAPTLAVAQRWLREVKGFEVTIDWFVIVNGKIVDFNGRGYSYHVESDDSADGSDDKFTSYEQAQEAGIKKALEIILEKGE